MSPNMSLPTEKINKELVGWRGFKLVAPNLLLSHNCVWMPGEWTEAFCNQPIRRDDHEPPVIGCTCGIYSFTTPQELLAQNYNMQDVFAEISLKGRVIEHKKGYRAQYAKIKKLYVLDTSPLRRELEFTAFKYEVDIQTFTQQHPIWERILTPEQIEQERLALGSLLIRNMSASDIRRNFKDKWNEFMADAIADAVKKSRSQGTIIMPDGKRKDI